MKIVQNREPTEKTSESIPVGTVFTGRVGNYSRSTFLKAFNVIVDLECPSKTWDGPKHRIHDYKKVNAVVHVND